MRNVLNFLLGFQLLLFAQNVMAQKELKPVDVGKNRFGYVNLANFEKGKIPINDGFIISYLKKLNKNDNNIEYRLTETKKMDNNGWSRNTYQQYYKNLEVVGASYVAHSRNNKLDAINGEFADVGEISITANFPLEKAKAIATNIATNKIKKLKSDITSLSTEYVGLVICRDVIHDNDSYHPAYKIKLTDFNSFIDDTYYIDAVNGTILNISSNICQSTAYTGYSGIQQIGTTNIAPNNYVLKTNLIGTLSNNVQLETRTLSNQSIISARCGTCPSSPPGEPLPPCPCAELATSCAGSTNYTKCILRTTNSIVDANDIWNAPANITEHNYNPDAHWGVAKTFDYFKTVHTRNSIDNQGMSINSVVDVTSSGFGDYAAWSGLNNTMYFGAGYIISSGWKSLDICAHEYGHGVCQYSSGLIPGNDESGALNEGFSDIWGAAVEKWATSNGVGSATITKNEWKMGEEIFNLGTTDFIRDISNPKALGYGKQQPNTYKGQYWCVNSTYDSPLDGIYPSDAHNRGTVLSHWFYRLSQGGCGTNDVNVCDGVIDEADDYYVNGIGITYAAKIAYATEMGLSPTATYSQARNISISKARENFPPNANGMPSNEEIATTRAWFAVGVGTDYASAIYGNTNYICGTHSFTVSGVPAGVSVTWEKVPSTSTLISLTPNGSSVTVTRTGTSNGSVTLRATYTITTTCGFSKTYVANKVLTVGNSATLTITSTTIPYNGTTMCAPKTYVVNGIPSGEIATWTVTQSPAGIINSVINGNQITLTKTGSTGGSVTICATFPCATFSVCKTITVNTGTIPSFNFSNVTKNGQPYPSFTLYDQNTECCSNPLCYSPTGNVTNNQIQIAYNNATSVTWTKVSSIPANYNFWSASGGLMSLFFKAANQMVVLRCTLSNSCGTISQDFCFNSSSLCPSGLIQTIPTQVSVQKIKIYPNPVSANKTIVLEMEADEFNQKSDFDNSIIQLLDAKNNIIIEKSGKKLDTEKIDLPSLSNGFYYVRVVTPRGITTEQILIRN